MDLTQYNSSPTALPDEGGTDKLPDGKYDAECVGFKAGDYRSGGNYIEFEYVVNGPTHAGRRVWQKTTLHHENPDRCKWGEMDRDKIAAAIGLPKLNNANDAIGKRVAITLKTKGEYQNVVGVNACQQQPPAAATMTQAPPPQNDNGAMPWATPTPQQAAQLQPGKYATEDF